MRHAICVFPVIARYANKAYSAACRGRRLFHHIAPPPTSSPVGRDPVKNIYMNPMAGSRAKYPNHFRYCALACLAIYANRDLVPIQPMRKNAA